MEILVGISALLLVVVGWFAVPLINNRLSSPKTSELTEEQLKKKFDEWLDDGLKKRNEKLINASEEEKATLIKERDALLEQRNNFQSAYKKRGKEIAALSEELKSFKGKVDDKALTKAREALKQGDTAEAKKLFTETLKAGKELAAEAAFELGKIAFIDLDYLESYARYKEAAELAPENHKYQNMAGFVADDLADYATAKEYYEKALEIARKNLKPDDPAIAIYLNNLGGVLHAEGDYSGAKDFYQQALDIDRKVYGDEHPKVAIRLNNLGMVLDAEGDYSGAKDFYQQALEILRKVHGEEHPYVAGSLNNLGGVLHAEGDYSGAKDFYQQALEIDRKVYGAEHPDVAIDLNNLAGVAHDEGDYSGAKDYYKQALEIKKKVYGEEHPSNAISLSNLGMVLDAEGDYSGAKEYFEEALAIYKKFLGESHPNTQTVQRGLDMVNAKISEGGKD